MNIRELIDTLTKLADERPLLADKQLFYIDRDDNSDDVKNVQLHHDPIYDTAYLDLGGQYYGRKEGLYADPERSF